MFKNKISVLCCLLFVVGLIEYANAGEAINSLQYFREIKVEGKVDKIAGVPLDKEIYQHIDGFSDIRITDAVGNEIPFRIMQEFTRREKKQRSSCSSRVVSLRKLDDNRIELIIQNTDKKLTPKYLTFQTLNRNFDKQVSVANGTSKNKFGKALTGQAIFDYSAIIDLSNLTVNLPAGKGKYYKVIIANFSETKQSRRMEVIDEKRGGKDFSEIKKKILTNYDFQIKDILLEAEKTVFLKKAEVIREVEVTVLAHAEKDKKTELVLDVFQQPIVTLEFNTSSNNFSRYVKISGSDDRKKWWSLGDGTITKIDLGNLKKQEIKIQVSEARNRYLKIEVRNGDGPVLQDLKVVACEKIYNAEFLYPEGQSGLKLYFGGDVPAPQYDIDEILNRIANPQITILHLGPIQDNPAFSGEVETSILESKILLYVIIGVMVLVLVGALASGLKKIEEVEE